MTEGTLPAYVVELAARLARSHGDPTPNRAMAVSTTQGAAANIAARAIVNQPETPVWLVVLHGHFASNRGPYGPPKPIGIVLSFTIDQETHDILYVGLSNYDPPDLSRLGRVKSFSLS